MRQVPQALYVHMDEIKHVETTKLNVAAPRNKIKHDIVVERRIKFKVDPMCKGAIEARNQQKEE